MPFADNQDTTPDGPQTGGPAVRPTIADGSPRQLDPRSIRAERLSGGIFAAVVSAGMFVAAALIGILGSPGLVGLLGLLAAWAVLSGGLVALLLGWPALAYRHTSYAVSPRGIRIERGVLWRSVSSVPRSRVQHTDVSQGPLERMFELATLVIYTAGTQHASVSLGGLSHATALAIRDHLITADEGDDAV